MTMTCRRMDIYGLDTAYMQGNLTTIIVLQRTSHVLIPPQYTWWLKIRTAAPFYNAEKEVLVGIMREEMSVTRGVTGAAEAAANGRIKECHRRSPAPLICYQGAAGLDVVTEGMAWMNRCRGVSASEARMMSRVCSSSAWSAAVEILCLTD